MIRRNCWRHSVFLQGSRYKLARSIRNHTASSFNPITAVPPASLDSPSQKLPPNRKWRKRLFWVSASLGALYTFDYVSLDQAIVRNLRCILTLSIIAADYKLNFEEGKDIKALHTRTANRVYDLIEANGGLYIKIGQAIAMQASVLPPVFQQKFAKLFDMAPQDSWHEIEKVFISDFGKSPDEVFESIEHRAIASASVAQVHKAKLKTGEWVAVKIQHPSIEKQMHWDLGAYRAMMYIYDKLLFDIPVYFTVNFTCNRLLAEANFEREAKNSELLNEKLQNEPLLKDQVYIPKVYHDFTSKRVLTVEWIDGTSLSNREELERKRFSKKKIMNTMVNLFAAQIFSWGVVHCDPHPGNQIVRYVNGGRQQLVLIDHGLYVYEPDKFRLEYCKLWKSMFMLKDEEIKKIALSWGIGSPQMFASSVMLRPYHSTKIGKSNSSEDDLSSLHKDFEQQSKMNETFRQFIQDTTKMPLELIFLGRNMRIVQGCNQLLGSPVNRIKILANWASRSLATSVPDMTFKQKISAWTDHFTFLIIVALSDVGFWITRVRQLVLGTNGQGFEDLIERQVRETAKQQFGLEIEKGAFEA
ncbi:ABC1 family-domain-containing protein [Lipomyces japonicus]|uniref:ABC1 family-domain-containing protein n=1 Tax=Lipomyces japonicus TaxID=56871 RepID=UPI0034CF5DC4